jgi:hypothetical protein
LASRGFTDVATREFETVSMLAVIDNHLGVAQSDAVAVAATGHHEPPIKKRTSTIYEEVPTITILVL